MLDAAAVATPTDSGQLASAAARVAEVLEVAPTEVEASEAGVKLLADAGYSSARDAVRGCGDPASHSVARERPGLVPVLPVTRTAPSSTARRSLLTPTTIA